MDFGIQSVLLLVLAWLLVLVTAGLCSWYPYQIVFMIEILILVIVRPEQPYLEGTMVNNNKSISIKLLYYYCNASLAKSSTDSTLWWGGLYY